MASHSPQRPRKPQTHPSAQGPIHNMQARETSRSPSLRDRPRAIKAQSMPLVPAVVQMFANNPTQQPSQGSQQSSPTMAMNPRRSPPLGAQIQRLLPTPPHPNPMNVNVRDQSPEHRMTPPPTLSHTHSQPNVNTHFPRPINRVQAPQFLTKFHSMDENWQMTDELLAEIERADLQQSQGNAHSYPTPYPSGELGTSPKDPGVERVRATERSSPKDFDSGQQRRQREQRDQQAPRESPKTRQATSPQGQTHSPDRQISPSYHTPLGSPGEHPAPYNQYARESSASLRRGSNATITEPRSQPAQSTTASQTPPLQAINARTPDRSLPVQEEAEDEPAAPSNGNRDMWNERDRDEQRSGSPTPSSDTHPEGNISRYDPSNPHGGRASRVGHRRDDDQTRAEQESERMRALERDQAEEEGGFTPRSPTAGLPETVRENFYAPQSTAANLVAAMRGRTRNGPTDQLGLRNFDSAVLEQSGPLPSNGNGTRNVDHPPQYVEQRRSEQQQYKPQPQQYRDPRMLNQEQFYASQLHPDDVSNYGDDPAAAYIQAYLRSPRPDGPIPPTPHSQTAAPSPSPLISGLYGVGGKELPPFSPVAPVGSPYPYPFSHVRRNQPFSGHPNRPQHSANYDLNPSVIQEQVAKQWQVYAQNNGHISDSTFSPSSTPFQGAGYNPWAFLHTNRTLGRVHDPMSLQSSPSHEPLALPSPPTVGFKKKDRSQHMRPRASNRKPPPRVESTQPRETSPEPSSSGEETAGEEHFAVVEEGNWVNGNTVPIADDNNDWVDEDDYEDEDDLLQLEYHPTFVSNVEKRRRRWENGWEALSQAFEALDRQTDATMVLMAAPSHSTKLHSMKSRSLRRQPALGNSTTMSEMRAGFRRIASQRRSTRSHKTSILDRLLVPSTSSEGSDGSTESREEDLKRALEAALGSLGALGGIYEQREARWIEEMRRVSEDREKVELLLRQVLGDGHSSVNSFLSSLGPVAP